MVAIGEKNGRHSDASDRVQVFVARLNGVDAKVALGVANQVAVEVVPVWLREPRPSEDIREDLSHRVASVKKQASQLRAAHAWVRLNGRVPGPHANARTTSPRSRARSPGSIRSM